MIVLIPMKLKPAMRAKRPDTSKILTRADVRALLEHPPRGIRARIAKKLGARPEPEEDAKDIMQESLARFAITPGRFVGMRKQKFLEKLLGDALGRAKDFLELHAHTETDRFPVVMTGEDKGKIIYDLKASWPTGSAYRTTTAQERRVDVRIELKRLGPQQQHIVRLVIEGHSYKDIGEMMGGRSRSYTHRRWEEIKRQLAARLEVPAQNIKALVRLVVESE